VARQQGLTEEVADQIDDGYEASELSDRQKTALAWTDAVLNRPGAVPADVRAGISRFLDDAELLEVTLALGLFHGLSRVLISLGLEPEQMDTTIVATPGTKATASSSTRSTRADL
jgi:alkylhydroperoxidase family enzyme